MPLQKEWPGETVFIVGGGPSFATQDKEMLRGRRVIVINSSVYAVPWADILIFGDFRWWWTWEHRKKLADFKGRIITVYAIKPTPFGDPRIEQYRKIKPPGLAVNPSELTLNRTTLTGAINLAVHLGARSLVLLGADGRASKDGRTHHHEPHPQPAKAGCWAKQRSDLEGIVAPLKLLGIDVVNASPGSAWDMWPVMDLSEYLSREQKLRAA